MALNVMAKLIIAKKGTEIGMRKDGDNDFGTFVPNYLGDNMALVTAAYSDGTDFIMKVTEQIEGVGTLVLTAPSGANATLTWDAANSEYKGPVGAFGASIDSHYDGVLDVVADGTTTVTTKAAGGTTTPKPPPPSNDEPDYESMTKADLIQYAEDNNITVDKQMKKADIISAIEG